MNWLHKCERLLPLTSLKCSKNQEEEQNEKQVWQCSNSVDWEPFILADGLTSLTNVAC